MAGGDVITSAIGAPGWCPGTTTRRKASLWVKMPSGLSSASATITEPTLAVTIAAMASEIGVDGAMRITPGRTKALSCAFMVCWSALRWPSFLQVRHVSQR